jgi:hypothetical protein
MKKATGCTGEKGNRICRCIAIEKQIMKKTHLGFLGLSSEDKVSNASEEEENNDTKKDTPDTRTELGGGGGEQQ